MSLLDAMLTTSWAMSPTVLDRFVEIVDRHAAGEKVPEETVAEIVQRKHEAFRDRMAAYAGLDGDVADRLRLGRMDDGKMAAIEDGPLAPSEVADAVAKGASVPAYFMVGDVAVLPVQGMLAKHSGMVNGSSQPTGMSYGRFGRALAYAAADPNVKSILLDIHSPGGTVAGVEDAVAEIARVRAIKPIVAFAHDLAASAAYWIAAACTKVVLSPAAEVGSVGVLAVVDDTSKMNDSRGVRRHVVRSGPLKAIGVSGAEINAEQLGELANEVAAMNGVFQAFVNSRRTLSDEARASVATGRVFVGQDAVKVGLADTVTTTRGAVELARSLATGRGPSGNGRATARDEHMSTSTTDANTKTDASKAEVSKAEASKPEAPKAEDAKPEAPKAEAQKADGKADGKVISVAQLQELLAAFPDDPKFAADMAAQGKSVKDAKAERHDVLAAKLAETNKQVEQLKAANAQLQSPQGGGAGGGKSGAAAFAPGVAPITAGPGGAVDGAGSGASGYATAVLDAMKADPKLSKAEAMHKVASDPKHRAAHQAWRAAGCPVIEA